MFYKCILQLTALSEEHLEAEFLIPTGQEVGTDLGVKGHHVELMKRHTHFSQTVTAAFDHAHFSLLLVSVAHST